MEQELARIRNKYLEHGAFQPDVVQDMQVMLGQLAQKAIELSTVRRANKESVALAEGMADEVERLRAALEEFADKRNWFVGDYGNTTWVGVGKPYDIAEKALRPPKIVYVYHVTGDGVEMSCRFTDQKRATEFVEQVLLDSGLDWTESEVEE